MYDKSKQQREFPEIGVDDGFMNKTHGDIERISTLTTLVVKDQKSKHPQLESKFPGKAWMRNDMRLVRCVVVSKFLAADAWP